jgi:hypothetical protein
VKVGDIYLVEIPVSGGHEQQGVRPAIIVQTSENIDKVPTVLIVPFTTQIRAANFPFTFIYATKSKAGKRVGDFFRITRINYSQEKTVKRTEKVLYGRNQGAYQPFLIFLLFFVVIRNSL